MRRPTIRSRWSLRRRLIVSIIALLAVGSIAIGIISAVTLQSVLLNRLDVQLTSSSERAKSFEQQNTGTPSESFQGGGIGPVGAPGTIFGSIATSGDSVVMYAQYYDQSGDLHSLTQAEDRILAAVPADAEPHSVDLGGSLGSYRVIITSTQSGSYAVSALPLSEVNTTVTQLLLIIGAITLVVLVIAFFVGSLLVRLALRPLERVAATATHVAELPLDRGEVALAVRVAEDDADPHTEVGQVGAAINQMLGHVASALTAREASEKKVRQFVADASHELRTPLASIRGYAELTRRGNHALPADVVHSIGRVESEATRMTSLVEDLLLLARLDEGRDLESEPLDLSRLLIDTVSDAHAAGPDHEWALDLPEEPVVVDGDAARLHQVIANLLANARVHTPAGTAVTIGLEIAGSSAIVLVDDNGPGIAPDLLPVLFERFARGDSSRSRAAGSTGLGLAIVAAVVEGHHGTVSVESEPGHTVFRLELPLSITATAAAAPVLVE